MDDDDQELEADLDAEEPPPEIWENLPRDDPQVEIGYVSHKTEVLAPVVAIRLATQAATSAPVPSTKCTACGHTIAPYYRTCPKCEGERNWSKVNALRDVIVELKEGRLSPDRERHLVKQLYELSHPDPQGLRQSLAARKQAEGVRRER